MGFNLSAGLAAADGFFKAQEHSEDRNYQKKQRDYQQQLMQAGLDTLPDQTAADRARLQLSAATNSAGLETLPGQTANTVARQGLEQSGLAFQAEQLPRQQQVASAGLDSQVAQIPENEKQRVGNNATQASARQKQAYLDFAVSLKNNDKGGALQIANLWSKTESMRQGTAGKNFIDIRPSGEGDKRVYRLVADDQSVFEIPFATLKAAAEQAKSGKYSMHQGRAGDVHVLNEQTGQVEQKVAPSDAYARNTSENKPAQLQLAEALMAAPENKGMTLTQAMEKVKTGLEMPEHQFVMGLVGKNALPGGDLAAEYQKWADLYGKAKGSAAAPSNRGAAPTIDPRYQSLFTP